MATISSSNKKDAYRYVYSCEMTPYVQIKICELSGAFRDPDNPTRKLEDVVLEATVYCDGRAVGYPVCTSFKTPVDEPAVWSKQIQSWNEWLTLPIKYSDLSRDAFVHFCAWELETEDISHQKQKIAPTPSDNTCYAPFPKRLICQTSMRFFSKRNVLKSGLIDLQMTLSTKPDPFGQSEQDWRFTNDPELIDDHLVNLLKQSQHQKRNIIENLVWLDQITKPRIEMIKEARKSSHKNVFLLVEMSSISHDNNSYDIVYYEPDAADLRVISASTIQNRVPGDPEIGLDNLCEEMHLAMTRKTRSNDAAKKLKPNKQAKDKLDYIIRLPSSQPLTPKQKDLVWEFRFYLKHDRRALNKFLHVINWDKEKEVAEALSLLNDWAEIGAEDALELLSPVFTHAAVREYAVSRLERSATPDQVLLYLPQLVQALKYEPSRAVDISKVIQPDPTVISTENAEIVEKMDELEIQKSNDLASFLIKYCAGYEKIANFLFWHLKVEEEATKDSDENMSLMYKQIRKQLLEALNKESIESRRHGLSLLAQVQFVEYLKLITREAKEKSPRRDVRESTLRTKLSKDDRLMSLNEIILPLDPTIKLASVVPDATTLFSSAMMPVKLTFKTCSPETEYTLIFKEGDDLRQDQLVIQMIRLMDTLFKREQMDLRLTPYAVLATGVNEGFVQFIKAKPLRDILKKYSSYKEDAIREAMRELRPDSKSAYGIEKDVIENYVRSLAGYSVVCYVLGVGDRHLDNLLLCENGRIFHVDFGYILGRDPKPMPPPMKLTNEMIQAMGGVNSKEFKDFCVYCESAYRILRRNANVILNLFSLMLDAGIPNIAEEKDKAVFKVEQRLKLELTDQEAFNHIVTLIQTSINARMGAIVDMFHDFNQIFTR